LQQGELSMVCVGLSERDLKNVGGQAKFWGAVALLAASTLQVWQRYIVEKYYMYIFTTRTL